MECSGTSRGKFNQRKIRILWAATILEEERKPINRVKLAKLTGATPNNIGVALRKMVSYLKPAMDPQRTDGCILKYSITPQGKRVLEQLLDRFARGEHLNIRQAPGPADYSNFELLPGLAKIQREQAGITGEDYEGVTTELEA